MAPSTTDSSTVTQPEAPEQNLAAGRCGSSPSATARSPASATTSSIERSGGGPAQVDRHRHAGDAPAGGAEEVGDEVADLVRLQQPLDRLPLEDHILEHPLRGHAVRGGLVGDLRLD